jgi:hypothetical protein
MVFFLWYFYTILLISFNFQSSFFQSLSFIHTAMRQRALIQFSCGLNP